MAHTIFVKGGSKMPVLNCSAMGCAYNVDHLCNKGTIQVDGSVAQKTDETCCASFRERSGGKNACNCDDTRCSTFRCK